MLDIFESQGFSELLDLLDLGLDGAEVFPEIGRCGVPGIVCHRVGQVVLLDFTGRGIVGMDGAHLAHEVVGRPIATYPGVFLQFDQLALIHN